MPSRQDPRGTTFQGFSDGLGDERDLLVPLVHLTLLRVPGEGGLNHIGLPQESAWRLSLGPRSSRWGLLFPPRVASPGYSHLYIELGLWGLQIFQQGVGGPHCTLGEDRGCFLQRRRRSSLQRRLSASLILCSSAMNSGSPTCYGSVLDVILSCISFWSLMKDSERVRGAPGLLEAESHR